MASSSDSARMLMGVTPADWDGILHWMISQTLESDICVCKSSSDWARDVMWGKLHNFSDPPSPSL